jgi:hypothetical protein
MGPASAFADASVLRVLPCPDNSPVGKKSPGVPGDEGGAVRARLQATGGGISDVSESDRCRGTGARASRRPLVLRLDCTITQGQFVIMDPQDMDRPVAYHIPDITRSGAGEESSAPQEKDVPMDSPPPASRTWNRVPPPGRGAAPLPTR